jgi:hypothetical protein
MIAPKQRTASAASVSATAPSFVVGFHIIS